MVLAHFNPSKGILDSSMIFTATDKNNPETSGTYALPILLLLIMLVCGMCVLFKWVCACVHLSVEPSG